ncbi:hypothetical protein LIER_21453 [Lithospermum erythrorhizon]|uniref:Uncharacterized protein n=1 Tax=Lithospermum erythrorhizon TaxID=34254 RepID=A0AAV3QT73_LITER
MLVRIGGVVVIFEEEEVEARVFECGGEDWGNLSLVMVAVVMDFSVALKKKTKRMEKKWARAFEYFRGEG